MQLYNGRVLMVMETRDRGRLQHLLRRDEVWGAYALADLDEPYFARTRWYHTAPGATPALVMTYSSGPTTTVMTFGDGATAASIIRGLDLAGAIDLHMPEDHRPAVGPLLDGRLESCLRLAVDLDGLRPAEAVADLQMRPVVAADLDRVVALYEHYPENCFEASRIDEGFYLGAFIDDRLVAVGGTHVLSAKQRVAAIGDLVTAAAHRGRGIGAALTAELCRRLFERVDLIALNVAVDNAPARKLYDRLGFGRAVPHFEGYGMHRKADRTAGKDSS